MEVTRPWTTLYVSNARTSCQWHLVHYVHTASIFGSIRTLYAVSPIDCLSTSIEVPPAPLANNDTRRIGDTGTNFPNPENTYRIARRLDSLHRERVSDLKPHCGLGALEIGVVLIIQWQFSVGTAFQKSNIK